MSGFFDGQYRINAQHRSQWSSVSVPFQSTSFSVDVKRDYYRAKKRMLNDRYFKIYKNLKIV